MFKWILIFSALNLLFGSSTNDKQTKEFIIWNIGQGLWTTMAVDNFCLHIDSGGENSKLFPFKGQALSLCQKKKNQFFFSHWDNDHISFLGRLRSWFTRSCLGSAPGGKTTSRWKKKGFEGLETCHDIPQVIKLVQNFNTSLKSNENSKVFTVGNVLIPGDSPKNMEKIWSQKLNGFETEILVLGHHGSRTSTGIDLLNRLKNIKIAIASSNSRRYGHPHEEVRARLKKYGISLLETQVWGNIHIYAR